MPERPLDRRAPGTHPRLDCASGVSTPLTRSSSFDLRAGPQPSRCSALGVLPFRASPPPEKDEAFRLVFPSCDFRPAGPGLYRYLGACRPSAILYVARDGRGARRQPRGAFLARGVSLQGVAPPGDGAGGVPVQTGNAEHSSHGVSPLQGLSGAAVADASIRLLPRAWVVCRSGRAPRKPQRAVLPSIFARVVRISHLRLEVSTACPVRLALSGLTSPHEVLSPFSAPRVAPEGPGPNRRALLG
jgi:hypothetical protein